MSPGEKSRWKGNRLSCFELAGNRPRGQVGHQVQVADVQAAIAVKINPRDRCVAVMVEEMTPWQDIEERFQEGINEGAVGYDGDPFVAGGSLA